MSWIISVPPMTVDPSTMIEAEPVWIKFAGVFQDSPMFDDVIETIQAERDIWGDEEMDSAEYQR